MRTTTSLWKSLQVMTSKLAILGAGGHGKVVADAAVLTARWSEIVFFDDACTAKAKNSHWTISGTGDDLCKSIDLFAGVIVAIGNNKLRLAKTRELIQMGARVVSIVHPSAVVSPLASVGPGSVVCAGGVINVDARIGMACIVNTAAVIEHDCHLSDGVHISPNASLAGQTEVGECSWIGIGSVTRELTVIGSEVIIGAGSVVVKSIPDGITVAGNPTTILK